MAFSSSEENASIIELCLRNGKQVGGEYKVIVSFIQYSIDKQVIRLSG